MTGRSCHICHAAPRFYCPAPATPTPPPRAPTTSPPSWTRGWPGWAFAAIVTVARVGKTRKPITPGEAAFTVIIAAALIIGLLVTR